MSNGNGAVVMVPEATHEIQFTDKSGKKLTVAQVKKLDPAEVVRTHVPIHPSVRLQFVPLASDKTNYQVDDVYQVELKKV